MTMPAAKVTARQRNALARHAARVSFVLLSCACWLALTGGQAEAVGTTVGPETPLPDQAEERAAELGAAVGDLGSKVGEIGAETNAIIEGTRDEAAAGVIMVPAGGDVTETLEQVTTQDTPLPVPELRDPLDEVSEAASTLVDDVGGIDDSLDAKAVPDPQGSEQVRPEQVRPEGADDGASYAPAVPAEADRDAPVRSIDVQPASARVTAASVPAAPPDPIARSTQATRLVLPRSSHHAVPFARSFTPAVAAVLATAGSSWSGGAARGSGDSANGEWAMLPAATVVAPELGLIGFAQPRVAGLVSIPNRPAHLPG